MPARERHAFHTVEELLGARWDRVGHVRRCIRRLGEP
jgi:hypothetical protein